MAGDVPVAALGAAVDLAAVGLDAGITVASPRLDVVQHRPCRVGRGIRLFSGGTIHPRRSLGY